MSNKSKFRENLLQSGSVRNKDVKNEQSKNKPIGTSKSTRNITKTSKEPRETSLTRNTTKNKESRETSLPRNLITKTTKESRATSLTRNNKGPTSKSSRSSSTSRNETINLVSSSTIKSTLNTKNKTDSTSKTSLQKTSPRVAKLELTKQRTILPSKVHKKTTKDNSVTKNSTSSNIEKKTPYNNNANRKKENTDRDRTRTRTLSPHEIKLSQEDLVSASSVDLIKLASLNSARTQRKSRENTFEHFDNQEGKEYEDDFEDYESDFEDEFSENISIEKEDEEIKEFSKNNYEKETNENIPSLNVIKSINEEDRKLDSGSYEMIERRRLRMAIERENAALSQERERLLIRQKTIVKEDEGFDENIDHGSLLNYKNYNYKFAEKQYLNFANAKERVVKQKVRKFAHRRGQELLKIIQLDSMFFNLIDQSPLDYENYIKIFGRLNACQAQTQTSGNDAESQTDYYLTYDKWTQMPVAYRSTFDQTSEMNTGKAIHHIGVGGDLSSEDLELAQMQTKTDYSKLKQFLKNTEQVFLILLEENSSTSNNILDSSLSFSNGYYLLNSSHPDTDIKDELLNNRCCSLVCFSSLRPNIIFSLHTSSSKFDVDWIAQWNLSDPMNIKSPKFILSSGGQKITSLCIDPGNNVDVVVAGFSDGSLALWDLNDFYSFESYSCNLSIQLQPASYTTSVFALEKRETKNTIIAIQSLTNELENEQTTFSRSPAQILTLEEGGQIDIWTIVRASKETSIRDFGLAPWGHIRLVHSQDLNLDINTKYREESLSFTCLNVDSQDRTHFYLGCVSGHVVHALRYEGTRINPKLYIPHKDGHGSVTCIETSPFKQPYFLVGSSDGIIRLYSRTKPDPIVIFSAINPDSSVIPSNISIRAIQWSRSRPLIFFVLDDQSRIYTWNIEISELNPVNIETADVGNNTILDMKLSSDLNNRRRPPFLALAMSSGEIHIHQLKKEYLYQSSKEFKKESSKFLKFINLF